MTTYRSPTNLQAQLFGPVALLVMGAYLAFTIWGPGADSAVDEDIGWAVLVLDLMPLAAVCTGTWLGHQVLRVPNRIELDEAGELAFYSPIGEPLRLAAENIWSIEAAPQEGGVILRGLFGEEIPIPDFTGRHRLLGRLEQLNPTIRFVRC